MELAEVAVVGERLLVLGVREVGVGDLELCLDRVVAVRVVVDDRLEDLDRLPVVHVGVDAEDRPALQDLEALGVELVGGCDVLEGDLLLRRAAAAHGQERQEDAGGGDSDVHETPGDDSRQPIGSVAAVSRSVAAVSIC
jgi:hypothetical protein